MGEVELLINEKSYTHRIAISKETKKDLDNCKILFQQDKGLQGQYIAYNTLIKSMIKVYKKY